MGAFAAPLVGAGVGLLGDVLGGNDPSVQQVNPNDPRMQALQGSASDFLTGVFGGANPFAGQTSLLQRQATDAIGAFLGADPQGQTLGMLQPGLMDIFNTGGGIANDLGAAGLGSINATLQRQLGGLSSSAPGRFSTAFASQGVDLASRAAQDFALLQAQARQQEVGNRLGAANLLGTLGNQQFSNLLGAGQLGLGMTAQNINPQLQLLLGGLQFARPAQMDTVVGNSTMDALLGGAAVGTQLSGMGGGSPIQQAINAGLYVAPNPAGTIPTSPFLGG